MAQTALLVVEDATLLMMVADPRYANVLPCLVHPADQIAKIAGCNACQNKKRAAQLQAMNALRACVAGVRNDRERKQQLKNLLQAKQIRVRVRAGQRVDVYTF